tara:strand:+ start:521 stop:739 length:219 start_codon:yes stop_codon:yes gene_type:complete
MMSAWDKEHLGNFLEGEGNHFMAKLSRLIADADGANRDRLREGFPEEVAAVESHLRKPKPLVEVFGYLNSDG